MTFFSTNNLINDQISLPKISVITIVRNGMPFIEQTIKSVIDQRNSNFEYFVIDGKSTDGTVDVIKAHESGITKWVSEKDAGISDAFNKGLSFATGDYILFLNADDALANPDVLHEMAANIIRLNYPCIIYGDCDLLERNTGETLYRAAIEFSKAEFLNGRMLPHPSLFTCRNYFEKYGNFDSSFRLAMDYEWLLRGVFKERVVHVSVLVTNVRNGGVSTQNQRQAVIEIISALKKNGYITSAWAERRMRGYFSARAFARSIFTSLGLTKLLTTFRNKQVSVAQTDLNK